MAQCPRCGEALPGDAVYCTRCGAPVSGGGAEESDAGASPAVPEWAQSGGLPVEVAGGGASSVEMPIPENIAGAVAYVTIIPAVAFLFLEPFKRNFFVRFHAIQHLFLWAAGFVFGIVAGILSALMQLIPFMRVLVFPLAGLVGLAWFFLWVLLVVKAYQHELFKLPIIGDLAEQQAGG